MATLFVVGNACLDVTHRLDHLPRAGETVNARATGEDLGGKGLNQAIAARRAGASVRLAAAVGDDAAAAAVRVRLAAEGISPTDLLARPGASDRSTILVDLAGENLIVSDCRQAESVTPGEVAAALADLAAGDVLMLQGNLTDAATAAAADLAGRRGARLALNPAPYRPGLAALPVRPDLLILNAGEAAAWTGDDDPRAAIARLPADLAVVTLGADGCRLRIGPGAPIALGAPPTVAVDSAGAGDVFVGSFVADWMATADPQGAARFALAAASDKVARRGTLSAFPSTADLARLRLRLQGSFAS